MAFYTIDFIVTAAGVSPDAPQFAGYTGDHRAAVVRFSVPFEGYRYRLELTDGCGGYDVTGLLEADNGVVSYEIPSAWTTAGVATLRLVAVERDGDGTEIVRFHSAPAYLHFADREDGAPLGESARPAWQETLDEAQFLLKTVEHKLENGELNGKDGDKGDKGDTGEDGYTPQKGVDYYTDAEREELIAELGARDVDQELDQNSTRAVANHVVTKKLIDVEDRLVSAETSIFFFGNDIHNTSVHLNELDQQIGEVETALDGVFTKQNSITKAKAYDAFKNAFRKGISFGVNNGKQTSYEAKTRDSILPLVYDVDVTITSLDSFAKVVCFLFDQSTMSWEQICQWTGEPFTVPANTRFCLTFQYNEQDLTDIDTLSFFKFECVGVAVSHEEVVHEFGNSKEKVVSQYALTQELALTNPSLLLNPILDSMLLSKQWGSIIGERTRPSGTIATRGCCGDFIKAPMPLEITANTGHQFVVLYVDDNDCITFDSGWLTSYTVPANQRFVFSVWNISGVEFTEQNIKNAVTINPILKEEDEIFQSLYIEYGRYDGATYNFIRIPKVSNNGNRIMPVIALTSADGSLDGAKCSALTFSKRNNLQFTINAGLFDVNTLQPIGQTIIDGVSIVNEPHPQGTNGETISDTECYPLCIDAQGNLSAPYDRYVDTATMIADGVKHATSGWGKLVDNFEISQKDIDAEIVHAGKNYSRQCIGQFENGDYCVLTTWGGGYDTNYQNEAGMTYEECAQLLVDRGVKFAYSLDGGGSAETVIKKRQINPLYNGANGRSVPSVIYFTTD